MTLEEEVEHHNLKLRATDQAAILDKLGVIMCWVESQTEMGSREFDFIFWM